MDKVLAVLTSRRKAPSEPESQKEGLFIKSRKADRENVESRSIMTPAITLRHLSYPLP